MATLNDTHVDVIVHFKSWSKLTLICIIRGHLIITVLVLTRECGVNRLALVASLVWIEGGSIPSSLIMGLANKRRIILYVVRWPDR